MNILTKLFEPLHRLFRLCLPPSDGDLWIRDICPSDHLVAERYQDWHKELLFIINPSWPASSREVWLRSGQRQQPGHLYLLLWQMRNLLMLTMLIWASSVCPRFFIVGVPPSASGLHVRESLGPPAKGYIVSYSAIRVGKEVGLVWSVDGGVPFRKVVIMCNYCSLACMSVRALCDGRWRSYAVSLTDQVLWQYWNHSRYGPVRLF